MSYIHFRTRRLRLCNAEKIEVNFSGMLILQWCQKKGAATVFGSYDKFKNECVSLKLKVKRKVCVVFRSEGG